MSAKRLFEITKDATIPISVGLLIALVLGVWALAYRVFSWEQRLDAFEQNLGVVWSYPMEKQTWREVERLNPGFKIPDVVMIREENNSLRN